MRRRIRVKRLIAIALAFASSASAQVAVPQTTIGIAPRLACGSTGDEYVFRLYYDDGMIETFGPTNCPWIELTPRYGRKFRFSSQVVGGSESAQSAYDLVTGVVVGDVNFDGRVSTLDFILLRNNFGATAP